MNAENAQFYGNAIFWVEVDKIKPNPYQPRHGFDEAKLKDLADSIRMYGVLQPLVVTRTEVYREDGGLAVEYELISGERRLRAARLAGVSQVPVIIRAAVEDARFKLELAIIENIQREDLNPVDRAMAFERLIKEFSFRHAQIAEKVGKSREYVANTLRILRLPEEMLEALSDGRISEGHTRPLLMLEDRDDEQLTLFKEIVLKKLNVRESEAYARRFAQDRVRNKSYLDPKILEAQTTLIETLGTRVEIERKRNGGRIHIEFFSDEDLDVITALFRRLASEPLKLLDRHLARSVPEPGPESEPEPEPKPLPEAPENIPPPPAPDEGTTSKVEVSSPEGASGPGGGPGEGDDDIYSVKNFTI